MERCYKFGGVQQLINGKAMLICSAGNRELTEEQVESVTTRFCSSENCRHCNFYNAEDVVEETSLTAESINTISEIEKDAVATHQKICDCGKTAVNAIAEMGKNLKHMRDQKLYTKLGYESFGEYVENNGDWSFKERQAYTYIKLYEDMPAGFLQSNANLGVTKLEMLTKLSQEQREEVAADNDLNGMTVAEIKQLIKEKQELGEQLTFLQAELEDTKEKSEDNGEDYERKLQDLRNQIEQLELSKRVIEKNSNVIREQLEEAKGKISDLEDSSEPEPRELTPEEIEEIRKTYKDEVVEEVKNDLARSYENEQEKLKKENEILKSEGEKVLAKMKEKNKELEFLREQALQKEKQAIEEKAKLKKQLESGGDEARIALKFYFSETQKNVTAFIEKLNSIDDDVIKTKFKAGTVKWLEGITDELRS